MHATLKFCFIRALCKADVIKSAGMTGLLLDICLSSKTTIPVPFLTSDSISSKRKLMASSSPTLREYSRAYFFSLNFLLLSKRLYFLWERIGEFTTILEACSLVSSKILRSGPMHVSRDIADFSRKESIGGLVT